ncbi:MFS transporter [Streptomonospora wellingtoniae]|uniref:MFS transporter n=1 Tax=Streptomonospora wellingtoniae TaxID=3075544 RepID=A0ABU2KXA3_9ACTN|nr:MFS transporter [Streptomonospora sp. DSM 45055]MDT0303935.1 MFS transporter [Streptomonospora sp. DSM 45055]
MSQSTEQGASPPAGDRRRWYGLAVVALAQLLIVVDMTIVNVALPSINDDLGIAAADRQWVITAYTLSFGGLLLLGGRIADFTGRRRALLIGLVGFAAASALAGAAGDLTMLLAARAAQGAFGALLAPAALALLATSFTDPAERGRAFGVFGSAVAAGSPLGLMLGGALTTTLSWEWVFYVNAPIALAGFVGALLFLKDSRVEGGAGYDVAGAVLATAALATLVYGLNRATHDGWAAPTTLALLVAGAGLVAAFLFAESKAANPLLPLPVLFDRNRGGAYMVVLLMMTGPFGVYLFVSFFLQSVQGYSALATGLAFLPMTAGVILASNLVGKVIKHVAPRFVMGFGLLMGAAGMLLLTRLEIDSSYALAVLSPIVMVGLGMGMTVPPALNAATSEVAPRDVGAASATFQVSQQVGASLGTALLSTVAAGTATAYIAANGSSGAAELQSQVAGYNAATLWGAGILAVAALIALSAMSTRLGAGPPAAEPAESTEPAPGEPKPNAG